MWFQKKNKLKKLAILWQISSQLLLNAKKSNETSHSNKIKLTFEEGDTLNFMFIELQVIKNQVESSKKDIKDIDEMVEEQERIIKKQDQIINYISSFLLIP